MAESYDYLNMLALKRLYDKIRLEIWKITFVVIVRASRPNKGLACKPSSSIQWGLDPSKITFD